MEISMSKRTASKPPSDPINSAFAMCERAFRADACGEQHFAMLQTVLIVRAIDRLTKAVNVLAGIDSPAEVEAKRARTAELAKAIKESIDKDRAA
jgi:hypothetical protein